MNQNVQQIVINKLEVLHPSYMKEVLLFIDFLLDKQQKSTPPTPKRDTLLSDIETILIPVNHVIIDRSY